MNCRTDLAMEAHESVKGKTEGVELFKREYKSCHITVVNIKDSESAKRLGKSTGTYITIEIPDLDFENEQAINEGSDAVARELSGIMKLKDNTSVLVAGLGNNYITPDSIGPKTVNKLFVTRHLKNMKEKHFSKDLRDVSALAPGVLGITGIETREIVEAVKSRTRPDLIIAVDALASRELSRLGTTIQITDAGINPGSGIGNNRKELSLKTMGIPVIAIGIPMVVNACELKRSTAENILELTDLSGEEKNKIIENIENCAADMIVTPNNVDIIALQASKIIADGINKALNKEIFM